MNIDQALIKAFSISQLVQLKLPDLQKRDEFLKNLLKKSVQEKREFFVALRKADSSLEKASEDWLKSVDKTKQKMSEILKEAKSIYRTAKIQPLK